MDFPDSFLEDVGAVGDDFSDDWGSDLSFGVGFSLEPDLLEGLGVEWSIEFEFGLAIEDLGELGLGEEGVGLYLVSPEHGKDFAGALRLILSHN